MGNLVTQQQAALLQSTKHQVIERMFVGQAIDQTVKIGVLHAQLDQAALG